MRKLLLTIDIVMDEELALAATPPGTTLETIADAAEKQFEDGYASLVNRKGGYAKMRSQIVEE